MQPHTIILEKTVRFSIDTGEVLFKLSLQEKATLFEELKGTFTKVPEPLLDSHKGLDNGERELLIALTEIWRSRKNWSSEQISRILDFVKESYI